MMMYDTTYRARHCEAGASPTKQSMRYQRRQPWYGWPRALCVLAMTIMLSLFTTAAYAQCSNPAGVEGDVIHNETHNVPVYCDNTNWIAMVGGTESGDYIPNAVEFRIGDDFLQTGTDLTGVTDTKIMTSSFWYRAFNPGANTTILPSIGWPGVALWNFGSIRIAGTNSVGTEILRLDYSGLDINNGEWRHVLYSIDLTDTNKRHLYVDGVLQPEIVSAYIDDFLDHTRGSFRISDGGSAYTANGDIADFWYSTDQYIDLSDINNVRRFIDASGNPVDLGTNGELPTGTAPDVFLSGDTDNWHTNKGTGGGFTENGTLTTAATTPYNPITKIVPSGLVGHWRLDETTGTTAFDSSGNGIEGTMQNGMNASTAATDGVINGALDVETAHMLFPPNTTELELPGPLTILAWVNPGEAGGGRIVSTDDYADTQTQYRGAVMSYGLTSQQLIVNYGDASGSGGSNRRTKRSDALMPRNKWTHVATVIRGPVEDIVLYINGEEATGTTTGTLGGAVGYGSTSQAYIGGRQNTTDALIDDVRIYNRALTPEEIAEIYAARDGIRYNEAHRVPEFFDGNQFVPMRASYPEVDEGPILNFPVAGCTAIGDVCSDGSVYAGLSVDGNIPMYTTPADAGTFIWNNGTTDYTDTSMVDCIDNTPGTASSCQTGASNTDILIGADSDSVVAGTQPHQAAQHCADLSAHGNTDWYLPAQDELDTVRINQVAIGGFNAGNYWSSSERGTSSGRALGFGGTSFVVINKHNSHSIRCVRKQDWNITTGGLVGHWKLDETSGTTAVDSSGNGNDGTMNSTMDAASNGVPGAVGRALNFMRPVLRDQYAVVGQNAAINDIFSVSGGGTIAFWYNTRGGGTSGHKAISKGAYNVNVRGAPTSATPPINFFHGFSTTDGEWQVSGLQEETWHHITIIYDCSDVSNDPVIYHNGVSVTVSEQNTPAGTCDSDAATDLYFGSETNTNDNFDGALDDVRIYDRVLTATEITQLYAMGAPVGSSTALPQGCPNIGDVCDDGTIYAGLTPDGNVEMFATPADGPRGLRWDNGSATVDTSLTNGGCSGPPCGTATSITGEANTLVLVTEDSDSGTAGFQLHEAAQYCYDLISNGSDDWYLPALDEAYLLFQAQNTGAFDGTIEPVGSFQGDYQTSTEASISQFRPMRMGGSAFANSKFGGGYNLRCVRKGPAPRCANPYGKEGDMFYNTTHNVVQYCDGARWLGIGKR